VETQLTLFPSSLRKQGPITTDVSV